MAQQYFAMTTPGLETALLAEVRSIGGRKASIINGGVEFEGTNAVFYRANYELRSANRVVLRVDEFRARDVVELYQKTKRYDWTRLLGAENAIYVRGAARKSKLIHSGRIAKAVEDGINDHFEENPALAGKGPTIAAEERSAEPLVMARLDEDRCQLSLDGSGELLYRRGWRTKIGAAPIRETIAAAVLRLADYQPGETVFDPMCGSGTFVIEAAQIAAQMPAGKGRAFALWRWKNYQPALWDEVVAAAAARYVEPGLNFFGRDLEMDMVFAARANAEGAGVDHFCNFGVGDVSEMTPPTKTPGLVVCNPPYGERLDGAGIVEKLVTRFEEKFAGWRLAMVLPAAQHPPFSKNTKLKFEERASFKNGGLPVRLWMSVDKQA